MIFAEAVITILIYFLAWGGWWICSSSKNKFGNKGGFLKLKKYVNYNRS